MVKDKLDDALFMLVDSWKQALTDTNKMVFKGDDASLTYLGNLMADGRFIAEADDDAEDARETGRKISQLIFATLISRLWRLRDRHPVFIDTGKPCNAKGVGTKDYVSPKDS